MNVISDQFDLVFCRQEPDVEHPEPDTEIVFAFSNETHRVVSDLFPDVGWEVEGGWHVAGVATSYSIKMALAATGVGLRVGYGELINGVVDLRCVEIAPKRAH